jgi:hypothetical protein
MVSTAQRRQIARARLIKVLRARTVATARTLEQKISDAGPSPLRINPHILTSVRNQMVDEGDIVRVVRTTTPWYHLTTAPAETVRARLAVLEPIHDALGQADRGKRIGQALEIAIYRALLRQSALITLGGYLDLDAHDDGTLYRKDEPPSTIQGRTLQGKLDFLASRR